MGRLQSLLDLNDADMAHEIGLKAKDFRDIRKRKRIPDPLKYSRIDTYIREKAALHDAYDEIFALVEDYDLSQLTRMVMHFSGKPTSDEL
jgi:hypothetical protein